MTAIPLEQDRFHKRVPGIKLTSPQARRHTAQWSYYRSWVCLPGRRPSFCLPPSLPPLLLLLPLLPVGRVRSPEDEREENNQKKVIRENNPKKNRASKARTLFLFFLFLRIMAYDEVSPQKTACWGQMKTESSIQTTKKQRSTADLQRIYSSIDRLVPH